MKLEVTKKDLTLIKWAVTALVIVACVRFLIMPALERLQDSAATLETTQQEVDEWQYEIDRISTLDTLKTKLESDLATLAAPYYGSMESLEMDELVTGIALNHNLFPVSLNIGGSSAEVPAQYPYASQKTSQTETDTESTDGSGEEEQMTATEKAAAEAAAQEGGTENSDSDASDSASTGGTVSTVGYLTQNAVSFSVQGDEADIMAFLDDLAYNYPSIQVKSFNMSTGEYLNSSLARVERTVMNCELIVFTCDEQ